jgi:hypothetical protein
MSGWLRAFVIAVGILSSLAAFLVLVVLWPVYVSLAAFLIVTLGGLTIVVHDNILDVSER